MKEFDKMTVVELRQFATENNIALDGATLKKDILQRIEAAADPAGQQPTTGGTDDDQSPAGTPPTTGGTDGNQPHADAPPFVIDRVLRVTKPLMKGEDVKAVQGVLIANGFHCGTEGASGTYEKFTAYAVRCFQATHGLIVDGEAGRYTVTAFGGVWKEPPSGTK